MKNRARSRQMEDERRRRQRHLGRHDRWKWIALGKFRPEAIFNEQLKAIYIPTWERALDESPLYGMLRRL